MDWISCKDQMPEEKRRVLACLKNGRMDVLAYMPGWKMVHSHDPHWRGTGACDVFQIVQAKDVTHWMPLPEAPNAQ